MINMINFIASPVAVGVNHNLSLEYEDYSTMPGIIGDKLVLYVHISFFCIFIICIHVYIYIYT